MASDEEDQTANIYLEENLDDENDADLIDDEEDDDDEEQDDSDDVTIADATPIAATPTTTTTAAGSTVRSDAVVEAKRPLDDSRRLFQRLWTDEDEIELLLGFLDYTKQRGSSTSHHDTAAFYDQIKGKLQLEFNKNQLVEKIRRLKKKYRNALAKITSGKEPVFKSLHDQAAFDICCKIWTEPSAVTATAATALIVDEEPQNPNPNLSFNGIGPIGEPNSLEKKVARSRKRSRSSAVKVEENYAANVSPVTPSVVEEAVKSCLLPLFKELVNNAANGGYGSSMGLGLGLGFGLGDVSDEKWRKQHVLELEVCLKRLELMQDQVKSKLEELRSMGS